jgi:PAS domain S-box-containing protein
VVESSPDFVLLINADHVCVYASPGVTPYGRTPEKLIGVRPSSLLDPDQRPQVWHTRAELAAGAPNAELRVRLCRPDGRPVWVDTVTTRLPDADGGFVSVLHGHDVTAEVELQVALTRSEERHRGLLGLLDDAVLHLDAAGRIESFNPRALDLLARPPETLLGVRVIEALDLRDDDGRPLGAAGAGALVALEEQRTPIWRSVARGDGGRRMVRIRVSSFTGGRPEHSGFVLLLQQAGAIGPDRGQLAPTQQQARSAAGLTAREGDVLDGLATGGDVPTIARQLGISVHSVRGHVKSITAKLGVHSQLQALIAAARRGMVDLTSSVG